MKTRSNKNDQSDMSDTTDGNLAPSHLCFDEITPVAPHGLGGLMRDHFSHGRLLATVGTHGGLISVHYWGHQHLGAPGFFQADGESSWLKLFRVCVSIGEERYYLMLNDTRLYPFGYTSHCKIGDVEFAHDFLLFKTLLCFVHTSCAIRGNARSSSAWFIRKPTPLSRAPIGHGKRSSFTHDTTL